MASTLSLAPASCFKTTITPGAAPSPLRPSPLILLSKGLSGNYTNQKLIQSLNNPCPFIIAPRIDHLKPKAAKGDQSTKPNSVICADCDGNGAVLCSQCKGKGVNSADLFNGQFKAGESCWLCGGRKEMLCGNCNGAGFIGGFMSTFDE